MEWQEEAQSPVIQSLTISGVVIRRGDRVRIRPRRSADIIDLALKGKVAVVDGIESDLEGQIHVAVIIDDDPGRDLGVLRQPGHRFFFSPDELDPLMLNTEVSR
jgi:hypothetical protein